MNRKLIFLVVCVLFISQAVSKISAQNEALPPNVQDAFQKYETACRLSASGDLDGAYRALRGALEAAFIDYNTIRAEPDLEPLRQEKRFKALMEYDSSQRKALSEGFKAAAEGQKAIERVV